MYSRRMKQSVVDVKKVLFLDPSMSRWSLFALGNLNNLNRDFHLSSLMGTACNVEADHDDPGDPQASMDGGKKKKEIGCLFDPQHTMY